MKSSLSAFFGDFVKAMDEKPGEVPSMRRKMSH